MMNEIEPWYEDSKKIETPAESCSRCVWLSYSTLNPRCSSIRLNVTTESHDWRKSILICFAKRLK